MVKVHLQNHSSVIIDLGNTKILTDPWYFGSCFDGGWGLLYNNLEALKNVESCDFLWISHFHPDHFHPPTLKKILEVNPKIRVIANLSYNFQMTDALAKLGYKNIIPFPERTTLEIADGVTVTRYPATGMDNMLVIRSPQAVIVHYNDCVLPTFTKKMLAKRIGPVDLFLNNFNHAGKLLMNPLPPVTQLHKMMASNFKNNFLPFNPKWVLPFASHHYYRSEESTKQNESLLKPEDLTSIDTRVLLFQVGQTAIFDPITKTVQIAESRDPVEKNPWEVEERKEIAAGELTIGAREFGRKLARNYLYLPSLLRPLKIFVRDLDKAFAFSSSNGLVPLALKEKDCDISTKSESLYKWFAKPYGTDSFIVGAHLAIISSRIRLLKFYIIFGMLLDNRLDAVSILKMLFTVKGLKFLISRREEICGILISGEISSEYQRKSAQIQTQN